jgi:hypothetical protein
MSPLVALTLPRPVGYVQSQREPHGAAASDRPCGALGYALGVLVQKKAVGIPIRQSCGRPVGCCRLS